MDVHRGRIPRAGGRKAEGPFWGDGFGLGEHHQPLSYTSATARREDHVPAKLLLSERSTEAEPMLQQVPTPSLVYLRRKRTVHPGQGHCH